MSNHGVQDTGTVVGIHTARFYDNTLPGFDAIEQAMLDLQAQYPSLKTAEQKNAHHARYRDMLAQLEPFKIGEKTVKNLVATVGRSVLMQRLANTTTYTGVINYGALGTGSAARANSDTQLGTEVFRKVVASSSYTTNVAFIDFFYSKADTNGTYNEFATFIDGTGSANTGQLFTTVLTGGWTKSSSVSMTVSCQYTLN